MSHLSHTDFILGELVEDYLEVLFSPFTFFCQDLLNWKKNISTSNCLGEERQMSDSSQKSDTSRVFYVHLVQNDK